MPIEELEKEEGESDLKLGDEIEVFIEGRRDGDGYPIISYKKAKVIKGWKYIEENYQTQMVIEGKILRRVKGGVAVDIKGVEVFMPVSQVGYPPCKNLDEVLGWTVPLRIIEFGKNKRNIIVSWRIVVETEVREKRKALLDKISIGDIIWGKVENITNFGAFINLGGIDGLLRINDISWGRIRRIEDVLKIGQEIKVKIIDFNKEKEQITLGLKQLLPHPWENIDERYAQSSLVSGKVVGMTNYGAFVELEEGLEGLIHIGDMSWANDVRHPKDILKIGDIVKVKILRIDKKKQKIALGLKQVTPNPWVELKNKYPKGCRITRKITHITSFGAFVEIEDAIEGLLHISDISWTKRIKHPTQVLKVGEQIEVAVLNVDVKEEKISLGFKQKSFNPYDKYRKGSDVCGNVVRIVKNGAFISLEPEIKGFVHISQISPKKIENVKDILNLGEKVWVKIRSVDQSEKRIDLSIKNYIKEQEKQEIEKYINQESQTITLGEILKEQIEDSEDSYEFNE